MDEVSYLFVIPIAMSLVLMPFRRQPPRYWWLLMGGLVVVTGGVMTARGGGVPQTELVGGLIVFLLPLVLMFLTLRAEIFARRPYLIPLLGPPVYWAGVLVALSVVVSLELLQP